MHRKTRILLCRSGFVALCVLPTTVIAGWIVVRGASYSGAAQASEWQRELTNRLGLIVELASVEYPSPSVARLTGLRLLSPETREPVGEVASAEVTNTDGEWSIAMHGLVFEARELALLARTLDQRLLRSEQPLSVRWLPCDVIVRDGANGQTLSRVAGHFHSAEKECQFELQFALAANTAGEPARLTARRSRGERPPATEWHLQTAGQALPCSLASAVVPELARLGADCEFRGSWRWVEAADQTRGELAGELTRVDLDSLVSEQFTHQLSGLATVTIDRATLAGGKLTELHGRLESAGGVISQSLIAAAREHLELMADQSSESPASRTAIPYSRLGFAFELSGPWLSLRGTSDADQTGALLMNGQSPLIATPPQHAVTSAALLRALLPASQHQVPATKQTSMLVSLLPLPDVLPPPAAVPQAHTPAHLVPTSDPERAAVRQPVLR